MDILPEGNKIGGAALNVAVHLKRFGNNSYFITALGNDQHGGEIQKFIEDENLKSEIYVSSEAPTGTARVRFKDGDNHFEIDPKAAWKNISPNLQIKNTENVSWIYFGSLCMFFPENHTLLSSIRKKHPGANVFCDINLRPPFYHKDSLEFCLKNTTDLKVNEKELLILADYFCTASSNEENLKNILNEFNLRNIICTMGEKGAIALDHKGEFHKIVPGEILSPESQLADTIGAGDAFSAAYVNGKISGLSLHNTLDSCSKFAAKICAIQGAIPKGKDIYLSPVS